MKNTAVAGGFFEYSKKEGKEKNIEHSKLGEPKVQRRENVGGSLNLWARAVEFYILDDINIIHLSHLSIGIVKKYFRRSIYGQL
jgi:hypothetical protein